MYLDRDSAGVRSIKKQPDEFLRFAPTYRFRDRGVCHFPRSVSVSPLLLSYPDGLLCLLLVRSREQRLQAIEVVGGVFETFLVS